MGKGTEQTGNGHLRADAERNRQRLLAAGQELFAERGLDVTLDEIARRAGVGTGTAYRRFANKHELIEALMVDRIDELRGLAVSSLDDPDPWDGLATYLEGALGMQAGDRGLKEVLVSASRGSERILTARRRLGMAVDKLVRRAVESGAVRDDLETTDIPLLVFMLHAAIEIGGEVAPELYRRYLTIILDGLRPARDGTTPLPAEAIPRRAFARIMNEKGAPASPHR